MSRRTEEEETEFKVPEILALCANCGVTGNPATNNMCQKCFNATTSSSSSSLSPDRARLPIGTIRKQVQASTSTDAKSTVRRVVDRCSGCRRKIGLAGFRCRCGELFCADHRYSDRHDCSYDYKATGREAIARENPVVKAVKMVRV